ncbi:Alpha/Beta hydrolase protein [Gaertneriomyces semiglobifer]|nr:Alpha/Beta hydrolase protein [Gaertneriomyces semiglobifer]
MDSSSQTSPQPVTAPSPVSQLYNCLSTIPTFSTTQIVPTASGCRASITFSIRDTTLNKRRKYSTEAWLSKHDGQVDIQVGSPAELSDAISLTTTSRDGTKTISLRTEEKDGKKKRFVEIWKGVLLEKSINVSEVHEDFYADDTFGALSLSPKENKLAYIAEKKLDEDKTYRKFELKPDWGEKLSKKEPPVIIIVDLESETVETVKSPDDLDVGQVIFGPEGESLVFWGVQNALKYGLVACYNRVAGIFKSDLKGDNLIRISAEDVSARSPRIVGNNIVYLANPVGGPHWTNSILLAYDLSAKSTRAVVDYVETPASETAFPGLFLGRLPNAVVNVNNSLWILTDTIWRSRKTVVAINPENGKVIELTPGIQSGSWGILRVKDTFCVLTRSEPGVPQQIYIGILSASGDSISLTTHQVPLPRSSGLPDLTWQTIVHTSRSPLLESILIIPKAAQETTMFGGQLPPLIVSPHGGPHAAYTTDFNLLISAIVSMGAAVVLTNYRGSIGFGKKNVDDLIGRVGELDTSDTHAIAEDVISGGKVDKDRVYLMGGSHGGFVSAFLSGLQPTFYKGAILRNPVTSLVTTPAQSDIPDWSYAEGGLAYDLDSPPIPSMELYRKLWDGSPVSVLSKVRCPTLCLIGENDRRVPPYEGMSWARMLKGRGVDARTFIYPSVGHALDTVEAETNGFEAIANFLLEVNGKK